MNQKNNPRSAGNPRPSRETSHYRTPPENPHHGNTKSPGHHGSSNGKQPASRRPTPATLTQLVQDYATKIHECESKRQALEVQLNAAAKQRANEVYRTKKAEWESRQRIFLQHLATAHLSEIWTAYARLNPGADHTHENPFLAWAHTSGGYRHGIRALEQDWKAATNGKPVAPRPDIPATPRRPYGSQPSQRNSRAPTATPPTKGPRPNNAQSRTAKATPRPSQRPPAAEKKHKAPLVVRNWTIAGIIGAAITVATAAMLLAG